jgi:diacylglycerol O-acyltransferase-1
MLRHVYYPAMQIGIHKHVAGVIVFFVSAVFHELLVGLPLHLLRAWSFIGILSQVCISRGFLDESYGNNDIIHATYPNTFMNSTLLLPRV